MAGILATALFLGACNPGTNASVSSNGVSEYTAILASIEAMRRDVRDLRSDIAVLRQDVNSIKMAPAPAAAAAPSAPKAPAVHEVLLDDDDPVVGAEGAGLAIVEFSDYECPFCVRFNQQTLPRLKQNYIDTGKVRFITRDMPLVFHSNATSAALAANCAAAQGAYEAMRAGIYANTQSLGQDLYRKIAGDSKLDMTALERCMQDSASAEEIRKDASYAASLGITGTPTFYIGRVDGNKLVDVKGLVGALPYESFAAVIDPML